MRYSHTFAPEIAAEVDAAVRHYADAMGVSEEEAWRVLEENVDREVNRRWRAFLAEEEYRWLYGTGTDEPRGIL